MLLSLALTRKSITRHLWESTPSHYFGHGGRGGNVIATFGPPFRVEYVTFLNNTQTDNPVLPSASVVKNPPTNHRLEGLTLDGGGGAYTGGVASATSTTVTLSANPFGNGTGTYISKYVHVCSVPIERRACGFTLGLRALI